MTEPTSGPSEDLRRFLVQLAVDPIKLAAFLDDPEATMTDAELPAEDQAALSSGDQATIHARLAEPITPDAVAAAATAWNQGQPPGGAYGGGWFPTWPVSYAPYPMPPNGWQPPYPWYGGSGFRPRPPWPARSR